MDHALAAEAFKMPGIDPRQWISYGTVDPGTDAKPSVIFKDDQGNPNPYGPMVLVTLQPSGISLPCRVAGAVAGDAEADWFPFVSGDEVLVAIPEGDERAGATIIGRLNQELDAFPLVVAGQDVTKNTFGFRRMRTPFIVETAASYLIRSATTGAQIGIDSEGKVIVNDGDQGMITIGPEAISMSSGDGETFVTLFPPTKEAFIGAGSTTFDLIDGSDSKFISQAGISFALLGGTANQTAVTAEQVVAFVMNVLAQLATMSAFTAGPLSAAVYGVAPPTSCQTSIASIIGPALLAMGGVAPLGPAPGGSFLEFQASAPPIFGLAGALTVAMSNPQAPMDPTGSIYGFGRSGFKL